MATITEEIQSDESPLEMFLKNLNPDLSCEVKEC